MSGRRQACPRCGRSWTQRDARFCGGCGADLEEPPADPRPERRRRRPIVVGSIVLIAIVGLGLAVGAVELTRPAPDPEVELDDTEQEPSPSPLSPDEAEHLQAQADPDALRCEPRGCERWRLNLDDDHDPSRGVMTFGNGLVGLLELPPETGRHRVVALDPATGEAVWTLEPPVTERPGGALVRMQALGEHALVVSGLHAVVVDEDGAVVWERDLATQEAELHDLWYHVEVEDAVVFAASSAGPRIEDGRPAPSRVVAVDRGDGSVRWSRLTTRLALGPDAVAIRNDDGRLEALDPASGQRLWEGPEITAEGSLALVEGWVVAEALPETTDEGDVGRSLTEWTQLVDLATGRRIEDLPGEPIRRPVGVDGDLVLIVNPEPDVEPPEPVDRLELVRLGADGDVVWSVDLDPVEQWWSCCMLSRPDEDTVGVRPPDSYREYDLATGELLIAGDEPSAVTRDRQVIFRSPSGIEVVRDGPERLVLQDDQGEVVLHGGDALSIVDDDPTWAVTDETHLLGVGFPDGD